MEIHFENLEEVIRREISNAQTSLKIVVAWLDFSRFEDLFISIANRNVKIEIIVDDNIINRSHQNSISNLEAADIYIKFQSMIANYGKMHHKFCIVDSITIINGSYNWTYTASAHSFENLVIIRNNQMAIDRFSDEFDIIKNMTPQRLTGIMNLSSCGEYGCNGNLVNLLIYGPYTDQYGESVGDIVEVCTENPYDHFRTIELSIMDNSISRIEAEENYRFQEEQEFLQLEGVELDEDGIKEINRKLDYETERRYMIYSNNYGINWSQENTIHAWGKAISHKMYNKNVDPGFFTKIYWKDRFVKEKIQDEYEGTFELY